MSEEYIDFVNSVTSQQSKSHSYFKESLDIMKEQGANPARLLTAALGLIGEGSEVSEIVKKCIFQGKPLDEDTQFHAKRELGDIMWYWINSCRALGIDPNEVIAENVKKLEARYPGGSFDAFYSENRKDGDL